MGMKRVLKHQDLQMAGLKLVDFHREPQLHVGENLNKITQRINTEYKLHPLLPCYVYKLWLINLPEICCWMFCHLQLIPMSCLS